MSIEDLHHALIHAAEHEERFTVGRGRHPEDVDLVASEAHGRRFLPEFVPRGRHELVSVGEAAVVGEKEEAAAIRGPLASVGFHPVRPIERDHMRVGACGVEAPKARGMLLILGERQREFAAIGRDVEVKDELRAAPEFFQVAAVSVAGIERTHISEGDGAPVGKPARRLTEMTGKPTRTPPEGG
jgi:hypothetical protein